MEMTNYLSVLFEWLLAASAAALLLWAPLLAVTGKTQRYIARVRDVLAWSAFIFAFLLIVVAFQKWWPWSEVGIIWLAVTGTCICVMGVLLLTKKIRRIWGTCLFLALLLCLVWSEESVVFISGYFRDYLPSYWETPFGRYWEIITVMTAMLLGIACTIALFEWKNRRQPPS